MSDLNFGVNDINMIADVVRSHSQDLREVDEFCGKVSDWTFRVSDRFDDHEARLVLLEGLMNDKLDEDSGNVLGSILGLGMVAGAVYFGYKMLKKYKDEKAKIELETDFFEPENVSETIREKQEKM